MKNTYISLDMLFIRADGTIAYIAENTVPQSLDVIGVQRAGAGGAGTGWRARPSGSASGRATRSITGMFKTRNETPALPEAALFG